MNDLLQQIKEKKNRLAALQKELTELQAKLDREKKAQQRAIIDNPHELTGVLSGIDYEIGRLEKRIEGQKKAIKTIQDELAGMNEEQAVQLRREKLEQVESKRQECLESASVVYLQLASSVEMTNHLLESYTAFRQSKAGLALPGSDNFGNRIANLLSLLRREVPGVLASFPREIFAEGNVPTPDTLRRKYKK